MQTSMLEILSVIYETSISDMKCLKEAGNIYQIATSPNIQSTHVISEEDETNQDSVIKKYDILHNWRWSIETNAIKRPYKLVYPSLGFTFGGSRYDNEFANKYFKLHDASSFVGEFLNYNLLSTLLLRIFINTTSNIKTLPFFDKLGIDGLNVTLVWRTFQKNISHFW